MCQRLVYWFGGYIASADNHGIIESVLCIRPLRLRSLDLAFLFDKDDRVKIGFLTMGKGCSQLPYR